MANGLAGPFRRAILAYNAFLVANKLEHSTVAGVGGASDSSAVAPAVVDPRSSPEAIALRRLLLVEPEVETYPIRYSPDQNTAQLYVL
eukprot:10730523-Heterocapsa_arctica.AAC.1